jgi:S1-C subfamily serine protease
LTAARFCTVLLSAVFFAPTGAAGQASLSNLENGLTDLVYRLSRSVVTVEASRQVPTSRFGSSVEQTYQKETTSGIVVDSNGLVLVAIRPIIGYERLMVHYENRTVAAELVAVDYQTELALLRTTEPGGIKPDFDTQHACAGQAVLALGHVSGFRSSPALGFCAGLRDDGILQFSIPSLGSRLGSGIFDLGGHLLGVVSELSLNDLSIVVAVPAYQLPGIVEYLLTRGDRQSGFVGITSQEIEISPGLVLPSTGTLTVAAGNRAEIVDRGVVVTSTVSSSPAARAGLAVGDLIYAVDHMPVNSAAGLASLVKHSTPGTRLQFDLLRQGQTLTLPLVVGRKSLQLESPLGTDMTGSDQTRLVDSLRQALDLMRNQINRLENRLNTIDQD